MAIASILVPTDGSEDLEIVLEAALVVARRFDAHIAVLHVSQSALRDGAKSNFSTALRDNIKREEERILWEKANGISDYIQAFAKKRKLIFSEAPLPKEKKVTISFHHQIGKIKETLIYWARLLDTTAVLRPTKRPGLLGRNITSGRLEAIMLQSGRPILMVPPQWEVHKAQHAVIAWNHSLEASRALAMTQPWLTQMKKVTIVVERKYLQDGERVVEHLAWHGVNANVEILNRRTSTFGKRILKICDNLKADFLVMGGFSHPRVQERVFGGETEYVMANSQIITVMVH